VNSPGSETGSETRTPDRTPLPRPVSIALRVIAAVACLVLVARLVGSDRLMRALRAVEPMWFAAAVLVTAVAQVTSALRWAAIARGLGMVAPNRPLLSAYAQGIAANALLPGATLSGDTLRSVRLRRLGNPIARAALSVLIDRASGLWVLCALSAIALASWFAWGVRGDPAAVADDRIWPALAALPAAAWVVPYGAGLLLILVAPWLPWHAPMIGAGFARVRALLARLHGAVLNSRRVLVRSLPSSIVVQVLSAAALWLCARAIGALASYPSVLAIAAPLFIAAALPLSIGGFGPREATALFVFPLIGVAPDAGVAAAALYGVAALVLGLAAAPLLAWSVAHDGLR
jgi:glycosyltransferase 2 family protein